MLRTATMFFAALALAGCRPDTPPSKPDAGSGHQHGPAPADGDGHRTGAGGHEGHGTAPATLEVLAGGDAEAGKPTTIRLTAKDEAGAPVTNFAESHGAKVHLIVVRAGLDRFAHLHPDVDAHGVLTAKYTFPAGGTYHLFADFTRPGKPATTAVARVTVAGGDSPAPPLKADAPGTVTGEDTTAAITVEGAKAGSEGVIRFDLTGTDGKPAADLEPYMGAMGHLVVLSADAKRYVHAHPVEGHKPGGNVVTFGVHFPEAGLYKGWGQFKRGGQVRVVPFVVQVP